jgi:hypothetical protein
MNKVMLKVMVAPDQKKWVEKKAKRLSIRSNKVSEAEVVRRVLSKYISEDK